MPYMQKTTALNAIQICIVFVHTPTFLVIRRTKEELYRKFFSATKQYMLMVVKSIYYAASYTILPGQLN